MTLDTLNNRLNILSEFKSALFHWLGDLLQDKHLFSTSFFIMLICSWSVNEVVRVHDSFYVNDPINFYEF